MDEDEKQAQAGGKAAVPEAGPEPEGGAESAPGTEPEPEGGGEPKDGHGQPGINREKYRRDIDARDRKIAELAAKVDELAKSEEGRADLQKQIDELKAGSAKERTAYELQLAGCRDGLAVKAAEALLPTFMHREKHARHPSGRRAPYRLRRLHGNPFNDNEKPHAGLDSTSQDAEELMFTRRPVCFNYRELISSVKGGHPHYAWWLL